MEYSILYTKYFGTSYITLNLGLNTKLIDTKFVQLE